MEMDISLMGCSTCRKVGWDISNMKRHVNSKACSGNLVQFKGTVRYTFPGDNIENIPPTLPSSPLPTAHESVDEQDNMEIDRPPPPENTENHPRGLTSPLPPRKRGRIQESLGSLMKDRISARDDGDETRIEYIFSTRGILESMLNSHIDDLPSVMFTLLYGNTSPRQFRSIFLLRNVNLGKKMVYEVPREDLEPHEKELEAPTNSASLTRTYAADLAKYILALAESIFLVSVPLRDNRHETKARAYGNEISEMKNSPTPKMVSILFAVLGTNISQKDD